MQMGIDAPNESKRHRYTDSMGVAHLQLDAARLFNSECGGAPHEW